MTFGSFDSICNRTALPLCSVVGSVNQTSYFNRGIVPECYARSVELANTMIFQIGNAFVHFGSLIIMLIIIYNVRAKYTAIGRTEMLFFFYTVIGLIISSLVVDCGVSPPSSTSYAYFVAVQLGFAGSVCISILYNGLLCFQFWEDGTRTSMWTVRLLSACWFIINFIVSLVTFKSWNTSLDGRHTEALFVVSYVINAIFIAAYLVSQLILVIFALRSFWSFGAIALGTFFFVAGQLITYQFSDKICEGASHYIDGLFFGSACNTFALMMVYKYWDMITEDDLEFSVANVEHGVAAFGVDDEKRASTIFN